MSIGLLEERKDNTCVCNCVDAAGDADSDGECHCQVYIIDNSPWADPGVALS